MIYWRKSISLEASPVVFTNRIIGLKVCAKGVVYHILNVYSFCEYGNLESLLKYKVLLAELADICNNGSFHEIIIIGDLNADPSKGRFFRELSNFVDEQSLFISDVASFLLTRPPI